MPIYLTLLYYIPEVDTVYFFARIDKCYLTASLFSHVTVFPVAKTSSAEPERPAQPAGVYQLSQQLEVTGGTSL